MSGYEQQLGTRGNRSHCFRFLEDLLLCVKEHDIHKFAFKCHEPREDYFECVNDTKKIKRRAAIEAQKQKLIKEGKWPPKPKE